MYNNNNNSHPDPFAGQYPTPPPPPVVDQQVFQPPLQTYHQPQIDSYIPSQPLHLQEAYVPPQPLHLQEAYVPPQPLQESYVPPPQVYTPPIHSRPEYYYNNNNNDEERHLQGINEYHEQPLDQYLRQEREEYMKHTTTKNEPTNQVIPYYKKEEYDEPEKIPMVQPTILSKKERKKLKKQQEEYQPYIVKPTLAPENEAESYKYRPYREQEKNGCNCCCYNPAITCCSFFCLLISIGFLAAGIALMIASKVVTDKCNNQCADVIDQAQNACGTLCNKVLHDGMFYGGIVVAALAGIAIIWKLIMWTCAGYSKR